MWGFHDKSKSPAVIVTGMLLLLLVNVAQSPNIKRKSQADATKTFLICEKHCFEKNAFKVGE